MSLTLSDLERSIGVIQVFSGLLSQNLFKITTELLLMMERKLHIMTFHLAPLSLIWSHLERSNRGHEVTWKHW